MVITAEIIVLIFWYENVTVVRDTTLAKMFDDKYNEIIKSAKLVKVDRVVT